MFEVWLTGVSGVPFKLPGTVNREDANRSIRSWSSFEGLSVEARPVVN